MEDNVLHLYMYLRRSSVHGSDIYRALFLAEYEAREGHRCTEYVPSHIR